MVKKLRKLLVDRVDLVTRGANPAANICFFKADEPQIEPQAKGADRVMTLDELLATLAEDQQNLIKSALTDKDTLIADKDTLIADKEVLLSERTTEVEALKAKVTELEGTVAKSQPSEEDIFKGASDAVRAAFEKAATEAREAREEVAKMKEAAETAEYIAKAGEFQHLPIGKAEEFGPVLRSVAKADKGSYDALVALLKASDELVAQGGLGEAGSNSTNAPGDPYTKLDAKAKELQKADSTLTYAVAFRKAVETNPDLYNEYKQQMEVE